MTASTLSTPDLADDVEDRVRSRGEVARLLAVLDAKAPEIEAEAEGNEQLGRLSDRTLELLREAEVPTVLLPRDVGGLGMYPGDALKVVERLAAIDGAVGWIGGNWSTAGVALSFFSPAVSARLVENGIPLLGISGAPSGKAVPVEGGYRLSGAWSYGSGDLQADYVFVNAVVLGPDGNPQMLGPMPRILAFGVTGKDIEDRGNWDVLGLRATGSVDFAISDVFVPEDMVADLFGPPLTGGKPLSGGFQSFLSFLHSGFAMGMGRRILDELTALAKVPSSRGGSLSETPLFRADLARHEAAFRSARAFVHETWAGVDERLAAGEALTRRDHTLLKLSLVHVHEVVRDVAVFAFNRGSGTTLRAGLLQRLVRDALAGCQHLIVQTNTYPDMAWELMGAPEDMVWTPVGLVKLG